MIRKKETNNSKTFRRYVGDKGESVACEVLRENGFTVLQRNYAVHNIGEIDIIAEKAKDIYIFEVRTRMNIGTYPDSAESVTRTKRSKVIRTAERYISENDLYDRNIVFEVIKVTSDAQGNILRTEFIPF